jgi:mannonate dehydratase
MAVRVALMLADEITDEDLVECARLGVSGVVANTPTLPAPHDVWEVADVVALRQRCEVQGLELESIENIPLDWYDQAIVGLPGAEAQIRRYCEIVRVVAAAGVGVLGVHWLANGVWRTAWDKPGRRGVRVTAFDLADVVDDTPTHGRVFDEREVWSAFQRFMDEVLPVAETEGVRLALHPDDPPVPMLGGVARIFGDFDGLARATTLYPSDHFGLNFCLGSWSEMGGDTLGALRHFAAANRIVYVHFRDVIGAVPRFDECFLGDGNTDVVAAMRILVDSAFDGWLVDDHVPAFPDEDGWRGHAHQTGYLLGLVAALEHQGAVV